MYREPAPKPKEPLLPLERFPLASSNSWLWFIIIMVMAGTFALGFTSKVHIECVRPAAGAPARCTGASFNILIHPSTELTSFTLEPDSIRVGKTPPNRRGYAYTALITNGGTLSATALDAPLARQTVADAERFREDPQALEWRAEASSWKSLLITQLFCGGLFAIWALYRRYDVLVLDPNLGSIEVRRKSWLLEDIEEVDSSSGGRGDRTLSIFIRREKLDIAWGARKSIDAATEAIERALKARGDPRISG